LRPDSLLECRVTGENLSVYHAFVVKPVEKVTFRRRPIDQTIGHIIQLADESATKLLRARRRFAGPHLQHRDQLLFECGQIGYEILRDENRSPRLPSPLGGG